VEPVSKEEEEEEEENGGEQGRTLAVVCLLGVKCRGPPNDCRQGFVMPIMCLLPT